MVFLTNLSILMMQEVLLTTVNELKEKFLALERDRSASSNSITDVNENRHHPYYDVLYYNQYIGPNLTWANCARCLLLVLT